MGYSHAFSSAVGGTGVSGNLPEYTSDPANPAVGAAWILRLGGTPSRTLLALFGGFPVVMQGVESVFRLSVMTTEGIERATLIPALDGVGNPTNFNTSQGYMTLMFT